MTGWSLLLSKDTEFDCTRPLQLSKMPATAALCHSTMLWGHSTTSGPSMKLCSIALEGDTAAEAIALVRGQGVAMAGAKAGQVDARGEPREGCTAGGAARGDGGGEAAPQSRDPPRKDSRAARGQLAGVREHHARARGRRYDRVSGICAACRAGGGRTMIDSPPDGSADAQFVLSGRVSACSSA